MVKLLTDTDADDGSDVTRAAQRARDDEGTLDSVRLVVGANQESVGQTCSIQDVEPENGGGGGQ